MNFHYGCLAEFIIYIFCVNFDSLISVAFIVTAPAELEELEFDFRYVKSDSVAIVSPPVRHFSLFGYAGLAHCLENGARQLLTRLQVNCATEYSERFVGLQLLNGSPNGGFTYMFNILTERCNGIKECASGSDEWNCTCEGDNIACVCKSHMNASQCFKQNSCYKTAGTGNQ